MPEFRVILLCMRHVQWHTPASFTKRKLMHTMEKSQNSIYSDCGPSACLLQAQPNFCALQAVLRASLFAIKKLYPFVQQTSSISLSLEHAGFKAASNKYQLIL
jgi:hypothetical protein